MNLLSICICWLIVMGSCYLTAEAIKGIILRLSQVLGCNIRMQTMAGPTSPNTRDMIDQFVTYLSIIAYVLWKDLSLS